MTLTTWPDCLDGSSVTFAVYTAGVHSYPRPPVSYPAASQVIWAWINNTRHGAQPRRARAAGRTGAADRPAGRDERLALRGAEAGHGVVPGRGHLAGVARRRPALVVERGQQQQAAGVLVAGDAAVRRIRPGGQRPHVVERRGPASVYRAGLRNPNEGCPCSASATMPATSGVARLVPPIGSSKYPVTLPWSSKLSIPTAIPVNASASALMSGTARTRPPRLPVAAASAWARRRAGSRAASTAGSRRRPMRRPRPGRPIPALVR